MVVKPRRLHLCTFIYSFSHIFIYLLLQCSGVELRSSNVYSPPNYTSSPSVCFQPVFCAAASMSQLVFTPMQQLIIFPLHLTEPRFLYSSIVAVPPVHFGTLSYELHFPRVFPDNPPPRSLGITLTHRIAACSLFPNFSSKLILKPRSLTTIFSNSTSPKVKMGQNKAFSWQPELDIMDTFVFLASCSPSLFA